MGQVSSGGGLQFTATNSKSVHCVTTERFSGAAAATFSHASADITWSQVCLSESGVSSADNLQGYANLFRQTESGFHSWGPTADVGAEFRASRFKLAPEICYAHFDNPTRNIGTVILGFTF